MSARLSLSNALPPKQLLRRIQSMQAALLVMLFPDHIRTHKHSWRIWWVLASVMTIQGILHLRMNSHFPWVQRVAHIAVEPIRRILRETHLTDEVILTALSFLRQGLEGQGAEDEACVYSLFNSHSWYIGKALLQRRNHALGLPSRIMEHLLSILRRDAQASRSTRAVLLRQRPAHTLGFILIKRGAHDWIRVSETVAIRALRPPGNKGQCRPTRSKNRPRRRNRPPPRFRQGRRQSCFWSSVVCVQQLVSKCRRKEACPFGNLGPSWSVQTFKEAYRQKQQAFFAKTGKLGPISIFSPHQGGLLALWACTKHSHVDSRLLVTRTRPATAVLRRAALVSLVQGYRRMRWIKCPDAGPCGRLRQLCEEQRAILRRYMGRLFSIGFWPGSSSAVVPFLVSWTDAMQLSNPSESQFHLYGIKAVLRLSTTEEGKVSEGFLAIGLSKIGKHYTSPTRTCNKICMHGCVITMSLAALDGTAGGNQGFLSSLSRSNQQQKATIFLA